MKFILILLSIFSIQTHAASLHPCTPTYRLMPNYLSCQKNGSSYEIEVNTLVSPRLPGCTGKNQRTYTYAVIEKTNSSGITEKIQISGENFDYASSSSGNGWFTSKNPKIHLRNCVSPPMGAISIGN